MSTSGWQRAGQHIRESRGRAGYRTRAEFAEATGLSVSLLSDIETGRRDNYDPATISRIEGVLGWAEGSISRTVQGRRPVRSHDDQLERVIEAWPKLSRDARNIIASLVEESQRR